MMEEKQELVELRLAPRSSMDSPTFVETMIEKLKMELAVALGEASSSGWGWLRGKSGQELARAQEILSGVVERIGKLALEGRDQQHRHALEWEKHDEELARLRQERYFSGLERAVKVICELEAAGIRVDVRVILRQAGLNLDTVGSVVNATTTTTDDMDAASLTTTTPDPADQSGE